MATLSVRRTGPIITAPSGVPGRAELWYNARVLRLLGLVVLVACATLAACRARPDPLRVEGRWVRVENQTNHEWTDVEIWVNERYVVHVTQMKPFDLKVINFRMLYNEKNQAFPMFNTTDAKRVEKVEVLWAGQMFNVPVALAD